MTRKLPLKVIHVNRRIMALNIKNGSRDPVITARRKHGKGVLRSNRLYIMDAQGNIAATILCDIDHPLSCGARCYIETRNRIVDAENDFQEM